MQDKSTKLLSLGAALAALGAPAAQAAIEPAVTDEASAPQPSQSEFEREQVNRIFSVGGDLLGFVITEQEGGTVLATHYSHVSHASHSSHVSHQSHYSSRY